MAVAALPRSPLIGVGWMILTGLCFIGVTAVVKAAGQRLPAMESAFLRYVLGLVLIVPMWPAVRSARLTRRHLRLFAIRGAFHGVGVICWFYAMTRITIAEVTALNYLSPIYITLGAALFLGESLALRRLAAVVGALLGALVILRPGFRELSDGHLAMLFTALFFAAGYLMAKRLADEVPASAVVAMLSVVVTVVLAPLAAAVWVTPTGTEVAAMFLVAVLATAGHFTMTRAFAAAPVTVTQPVTFMQLVWATLLGWAVFGEVIDLWVVAGGLIILAAVTALSIREAVLSRRAAPPPDL